MAEGTINVINPYREGSVTITIPSIDPCTAGEVIDSKYCPDGVSQGDVVVFRVVLVGPASDRRKLIVDIKKKSEV